MYENDGDAFQLLVGPTRLEGYKNFLATDPSVERGRGLFMVRQTFHDRASERPANLKMAKLVNGAPICTPSEFTCEQLDEGLRSAGLLVAAAPMMFAKWADEFRRNHPNELPLFNVERSNAVGGDPAIRYYHSYWALEPGQALLIEATPPQCSTWNFQLNNYWMESLDFR